MLSLLREILSGANYYPGPIAARLGETDLSALDSTRRVRLLHRTRGGDPLDTLIRLFLLSEPVSRRDASQALAPFTLETAGKLGLVRPAGHRVLPALSLFPYEDLILAFDPPHRSGRSDRVIGVTTSTVELARFAIRRHSRHTLDLGTGCGIHALLAARHSDAVWAVDANPRAVRLARLNAQLNAIPNLQCLAGDAFQPVRRRRFDLILANLPFVIAPGRRFLFRDSGLRLDGFARRVIRQAPRHLEEGGFCQLVCQWVHRRREDWRERLSAWFAGAGCDAWVLRVDTKSPDVYAEDWLRDTEPDRTPRRFREWMDYYEAERVEAISSGLVALRRRSDAENWLRIGDAPARVAGPFGDAVLDGFALRDFSQGRGLLRACLKVAGNVRLMQTCAWSPGAWQAAALELHKTEGLPDTGQIDANLATLLARCDGRRTLGELLSEMAAALGLPSRQVTRACLPLVRNLIEHGFLRPA